MNNWKARLGKALDGLGSSVNAFGIASFASGSHDALYWMIGGFACSAAGKFWGTLFPETDGGQKAAEQLPPTLR